MSKYPWSEDNRAQEIVHNNKWLTDKIKNFIKNLDNRIRFLFKPYESFSKMNSLFGLNEYFLRDQRYSVNAKKVIAKSILDNMCLNFKQKIREWINLYPQFADLLLKVQSEILSFINDYEQKFNPKPTPRYQMYDHHPNFKRDYFSEILTLEQAYWLGFLFADAYIAIEHKNSGDYYRMGIGLSSKDEEFLIKFCEDIGLNLDYINQELSPCSYTDKKYPISKIRWGDQDFANDLIKLGMEYKYDENKGRRVKSMKFPDLGSRELMLAFLLGFYDGDGSLGLVVYKGGKKKIFPTIISCNKEFLLQVKNYFDIKYDLYSQVTEKYDFKKDKIVKSKGYRLYLGSGLLKEMLKNYRDSLERKRFSVERLENYGISNERRWLTEVLSKDKLQQILEILSPHLIGETLGLDGRTIVSFAKKVHGIDFKPHGHYTTIRNSIRWNGENSQYFKDFYYWIEYLKKLPKDI